jgi:hypothetical protein
MLQQLDLDHHSAAVFFKVNDRTCRRWLQGVHDIPESVAMVLHLMLRHGFTPEEVKRWNKV